jgi:hypothetical protein
VGEGLGLGEAGGSRRAPTTLVAGREHDARVAATMTAIDARINTRCRGVVTPDSVTCRVDPVTG